jgi:hypothetical protein
MLLYGDGQCGHRQSPMASESHYITDPDNAHSAISRHARTLSITASGPIRRLIPVSAPDARAACERRVVLGGLVLQHRRFFRASFHLSGLLDRRDTGIGISPTRTRPDENQVAGIDQTRQGTGTGSSNKRSKCHTRRYVAGYQCTRCQETTGISHAPQAGILPPQSERKRD